MKILITGHNGFIGKNVVANFSEKEDVQILTFGKEGSLNDLEKKINQVEIIFHFAGVNRPEEDKDFGKINTGLTKVLCDLCRTTGRSIPIVFASSVHVERDNEYGRSKLFAEEILQQYHTDTASLIYIFRLPHVIGKWCRPNYNSVVATFCYNIINNLPISIVDPSVMLKIIYIDDLVKIFYDILSTKVNKSGLCNLDPIYTISVGELAEQLQAFKTSRTSLISENVGIGLKRALYSTYLSYLSKDQFSYNLLCHADVRGSFVEVLKTKEAGQFSYFTAHPGVTRGGHYHHTKTEKFVVIKGTAQFKFENLISGECYNLITKGGDPKVVETIPGWIHDVTNIGDEELIFMLWANEVFNPKLPDTINKKMGNL